MYIWNHLPFSLVGCGSLPACLLRVSVRSLDTAPGHRPFANHQRQRPGVHIGTHATPSFSFVPVVAFHLSLTTPDVMRGPSSHHSHNQEIVYLSTLNSPLPTTPEERPASL